MLFTFERVSGDGCKGTLALGTLKLKGDWLVCIVAGVVFTVVVGFGSEGVSSMLSLFRCKLFLHFKFLLNLFAVRCLLDKRPVMLLVDVSWSPLMLHSSFEMPWGFGWGLVCSATNRSRMIVAVVVTVWDSLRGRPRFFGTSAVSLFFLRPSIVGVTTTDVDKPVDRSDFRYFCWFSHVTWSSLNRPSSVYRVGKRKKSVFIEKKSIRWKGREQNAGSL